MRVWFDRVSMDRHHDGGFLAGESLSGEIHRSRRPPDVTYDLRMRIEQADSETIRALHLGSEMFELVEADDFDRVRGLAERTLTAEATIAEMGGATAVGALSSVRMARFFYLCDRETAGTPVRQMMDLVRDALYTHTTSDMDALEALGRTLAAQRVRMDREAVSRVTGATVVGMPESYTYSIRDMERARLSSPRGIVPLMRYERDRLISDEQINTVVSTPAARTGDQIAAIVRAALEQTHMRVSGITEVTTIHVPAPQPAATRIVPDPVPEGTRFDLLEVDVEPRVASGLDGPTQDAVPAAASRSKEDRKRGGAPRARR